MATKLSWFSFIAFVIIKLLWNGLSEPLTEVHWDSVVHLEHAKQFADTAFIKNHAQQASAIAAQVDGHWSRGEQFSTAYWRFSRLGHIALLGMIVQMFGAGKEAIIAAHWLYNTLIALTMVFAVILIMAIVNHLGINRLQHVVLWTAAGSATLYMMSDIYNYTGRCLVSEVPAMFLLTVASLLFITGLNRRSIFLSCLSGFCVFLAYSVRLESVWLYIAFCVVLVPTLWIRQRRTQWLRTYAFAGGTAFACYLLYAWYFYPLANPYLFILFAKYQPVWGGEWTVPIYVSMSVAGGLLWIGVFASMIATTHWTAARIAFVWLGVTLLPTFPYLIYNSIYTVPLQSRMLTVTLVLPLLLASTLGLAYLWDDKKRWLRCGFFALALTAIFLIVISISPAFEQLKLLPDILMINRLRTFLLVPTYERNTYRFDEMNRISQAIYSKNTFVFLVYNKDDIRREDISLIRFFGPAFPPQANLTMVPANYTGRCEESIPAPPSLEKVSYCVGITTDKLQQLIDQGITVFFLTSLLIQDDITMPFNYTEVLRTKHYRLGIIAL